MLDLLGPSPPPLLMRSSRRVQRPSSTSSARAIKADLSDDQNLIYPGVADELDAAAVG